MKALAKRAARLTTALVVIVAVSAGLPGMAAAHVLRTDNGVSAVMHIPPDDNPVAGDPTTIQLIFSGTDFDFDVHTCGCTLTVTGGTAGAQTTSLQTFQGDDSSARATVTFPAAGVYALKVQGSSEAGAFNLVYDTRVNKNPNTAAISTTVARRVNMLLLAVVGLVLLAMAVYYAAGHRAAKSSNKN